jgi:hypothetical protein
MNNGSGKVNSKWSRVILLSVWAAVALAFLVVYAADLRLSYDLLAAPCTGPDCHYQAITPAEAAVLENAGLSAEAYAVYMLGTTVFLVLIYLVLALLILKRLYPQRLALVLSLPLIVIPLNSITSYDVVADAFPDWSAAIVFLFGLGGLVAMSFYIVFPNGRLAPRWSLLLPIIWAYTSVSDVLANIGANPGPRSGLTIFLVVGTLIGVLTVIFYRYRRLFNRTERQQVKWVLLGILIYFTAFPVWAYTFELSDPSPGQAMLVTTLAGWTLAQFLSLALPIAIFIAILRYRLWDIDLIVRRTLVYGTVTAFLAAV